MKYTILFVLTLSFGFVAEAQNQNSILTKETAASWDLFTAHQAWSFCRRGNYDRQVFNKDSATSTVVVTLTAAFMPLLEGPVQALTAYSSIIEEVEANARNGQTDFSEAKTYQRFLTDFTPYLVDEDPKSCSVQASSLLFYLEKYLDLKASLVEPQ